MDRSVQVVILNWNGYELTRDCLRSLENVEYDNLRTVVVDNASSDDSCEKLMRDFPKIDFLKSETNLGFAGGNNIGINFSKKKYDPDFFLLLNNDTIVDSKFIKPLVTSFHNVSNVGIAGSKIYYYDDPGRIWFAGGVFDKFKGDVLHLGEGEIDNGQFNTPGKVDFITGCCLMMSRNVVTKIGILDEHFFAYCEDLDYSLRASEFGFDCYYVPTSHIYHKVSSSFKKKKSASVGKRSPLAYYLNVRNRIFIFRKHRKIINSFGFIIFQTKFVLRYLIGFTFTWQFQKTQGVLKGVWHGINMPLETSRK